MNDTVTAGHPDNWPRQIARKHTELEYALNELLENVDEANKIFALREFIREWANQRQPLKTSREIQKLKARAQRAYDLMIAAQTRAHDLKDRCKSAEHGLRGLLQRCQKAENVFAVIEAALTIVENDAKAYTPTTQEAIEIGTKQIRDAVVASQYPTVV